VFIETYDTLHPIFLNNIVVNSIIEGPVNAVLMVKDRDINMDLESIDKLTSQVDVNNDVMKLFIDTDEEGGLDDGEPVIYKMRVRKSDRTLVDIPNGYKY